MPPTPAQMSRLKLGSECALLLSRQCRTAIDESSGKIGYVAEEISDGICMRKKGDCGDKGLNSSVWGI